MVVQPSMGGHPAIERADTLTHCSLGEDVMLSERDQSQRPHYVECTKPTNPQRQKVGQWLPRPVGAGGPGVQGFLLRQ